MRKMLVVASREYQAAVRSKTFIVSLVMMPVLMLASIVFQAVFGGVRDIADRKFVVIDRLGRAELVRLIHMGAAVYNEKAIYEEGKQVKPKFVVETRVAAESTSEDRDRERFELSEKIRRGELTGFLEILPPLDKSKEGVQLVLRYQSNNPTYTDFSKFVELAVTKYLQEELGRNAGLKEQQVQSILKPVVVESKGLSKRDSQTGKVIEASEQSRVAAFLVPFVLMMLMFMVLMMTATPLMQGVVEEKMQRIAEVLLGSVQPFQLMMGKLIGMTGVSLTIALVYLAGGYWVAERYGVADAITWDLVLWFVFFQILAGLMFGSLFIAVGAACTELKETQNLMWPVMLLAMLPMFMMGTVMREPNSPVVRGMSFFPFATPTLMITRQAVPPGLPWWEPLVGALIVLATTVFCVFAAGRIFRVGILLQGKGAKVGQMLKWVFRG